MSLRTAPTLVSTILAPSPVDLWKVIKSQGEVARPSLLGLLPTHASNPTANRRRWTVRRQGRELFADRTNQCLATSALPSAVRHPGEEVPSRGRKCRGGGGAEPASRRLAEPAGKGCPSITGSCAGVGVSEEAAQGAAHLSTYLKISLNDDVCLSLK